MKPKYEDSGLDVTRHRGVPKDQTRYLSIADVCEILNCARPTVSHYIRRGKLAPTFYIGRNPRFSPETVEEFIEKAKDRGFTYTSGPDEGGLCCPRGQFLPGGAFSDRKIPIVRSRYVKNLILYPETGKGKQMTRAGIYCRVSTGRQREEGESLAIQQSRLTAYCTAQGFDVVKVYVDAGISAKDTKRPQFQALMRDAVAVRC
jgi:excisionase family DNA binding protein